MDKTRFCGGNSRYGKSKILRRGFLKQRGSSFKTAKKSKNPKHSKQVKTRKHARSGGWP